MGRPLKQGLDYFPHDTDAVNDEKIEAMRALYGAEGYAFYFIALERIYRTDNGRLDVGSKEKRALLASKIGVDDPRFLEILDSAFEVGLFDKKLFDTKGYITSPGIKKRVVEVNKSREKWRKKREAKLSPEKSGVITPLIPGASPEISAQRKEKKSKGKESNNIPPKAPKGAIGVFQAYAGEDGALLGALKDFDEMRRRMKKPMTDRAKNMLLKKLDTLAKTPEEKTARLDDAVLHCWLTVYESRESGAKEDDSDVL